MSGQWKVAVETSRELKYLIWKQHRQVELTKQGKVLSLSVIPDGRNLLSKDSPPMSPKLLKKMNGTLKPKKPFTPIEAKFAKVMEVYNFKRPYGYWQNPENVKDELIQYLEAAKSIMGRPVRWLPRFQEFRQFGRSSLVQPTRQLYGSAENLCQKWGLIPHTEWIYFDCMVNMTNNLVRYYNQHYEGRMGEYFPLLSEIIRQTPEEGEHNYYKDLYYQIMKLGGRRAVSQTLGIQSDKQPEWHLEKYGRAKLRTVPEIVVYEPLSLLFVQELLEYIRECEMAHELQPLEEVDPNAYKGIKMPSVEELRENGKESLARQVEEAGGAKDIAVRLYLRID
mmetsp:Transcript_8513/g.13190  ORF Transcript_8513/g.13190 Transcript_8513/m.13190 type:complete len:337 (-) Transcript_8513:8-1018(-)